MRLPYLRWLCAALVACITLLAGDGVLGQQAGDSSSSQVRHSGLQLLIVPQSAQGRSYAHVPVNVTLDYFGPGIMTGKLVLSIFDGGSDFYSLEVPDIVVSGGKYRTQLLLPPAAVGSWRSADFYLINARFVTDDGKSHALDTQQVTFSGASPSVRAVAVCVAGDSASLPVKTSGAGLRFEQMLRSIAANYNYDNLTPEERVELVRESFDTMHATIQPADMPSVAEAYCSYDVLVIAGRALGLLDSDQLGAIEAWVRAGGNLLVVPGTGMRAEHEAFLKRLAIDKGPVPLQSYVMGQTEEPMLVEPDLGRMVIWPSGRDTPNLAGRPEWRDVTAFLWRVYEPTRKAYVDTEPPRPEPKAPPGANRVQRNWENPQFMNAVSMAPSLEQTMFERWFLPRSLQLVPTWWIALLFVGLLVVGVPLDYLGLGLLKRRRWTWIVFPAACVAATVVMISVSYRYLGSHQSRQTLTIVDIDANGQPLRATSLAVDFVSRVQNMSSIADGALQIPVESQDLQHYSGYYDYSHQIDAQPAIYTGRPGRHVAVTRSLKQWQPSAVRRFDIAPVDIPPVCDDWSKVVDELESAPLADARTLDLTAVTWPAGTSRIFVAGEQYAKYRGDFGYQHPFDSYNYEQPDQFYTPQANVKWKPPFGTKADATSNVVAASVEQLTLFPSGLFTSVHMIAPHGGPRLNDLPLAKERGADGRFVLVVIRFIDDTNVIAYRYLHRETP
jgi:hypothetical protein